MSSTHARRIPSIEQLRQSPRGQKLAAVYGRDALVAALREAAAELRAAANTDAGPDIEGAVMANATARLAARFQTRLRPVINATGIIIHTNLGRAPLAAEALARVQAIGAGYASIEYDLDAGHRGRRDLHAEPLLRDLTGAGAAIIVNNNAAAVLLMLTALAQGREVLISRGELVEIGGGFRVPDVMRQSGALLREVGTTNRTRVADYAACISDRTALILRVHPSNFVIEGFTERPDLHALAALGRQFNIPVVEDLGSGYLGGVEVEGKGLHEPDAPASLRAGVDVVTFSGDKLLGGPQAGIIAGRADLVDIMRRHPLMRALRVDKLTYAALEGTLIEIARGRATTAVPVLRMLSMRAADIGARAERLAQRLAHAGLPANVIDGESAIGGGSAPGARLPTRLLVLYPDEEVGRAPDARADRSADRLLAQLRECDPPVIARIESDRVVLDLRTVLDAQDEPLASALISALRARG